MEFNKENLDKAFSFTDKLIANKIELDVTNGKVEIRRGGSFVNENGEYLEEIYKGDFTLTFWDILGRNNDITEYINEKLEDGFYTSKISISKEGLTVTNIEKYVACIRIQGILNNKIKKLLKINQEEDNWYFTSYSDENFLAGKYGDYELLETSDQFGYRFNYIPRGWKMISKIDGINNEGLKRTEYWDFKEQLSIPFPLDYKYLSDKELKKAGGKVLNLSEIKNKQK